MKILLQSSFENMEMYSNYDELPTWFWPVWAIVMVFFIVCLWRIYAKCKEPGWAAIVPFYNIYVWARMIKKPQLFTYILIAIGVYILGFILTVSVGALAGILVAVGGIAMFVIMIMMYHGLSLAFGQGAGFTVGLILLSIIFIPILAFGNYEYVLDKSQAAGSEVLDA